jgi:GNAT superfamily N-acetyltransferase
MDIRTATLADAEAVLQFWMDSGASMSVTDEPEYVRRVIQHPSAVLLLARSEGRIIGTLLGTFDGWRGNLYRLVVGPEHRRQGIARQLVRRMERTFSDWGVRRITVLVEQDRPWAVEFWNAVGYPRDEHIVRHLGRIERVTPADSESTLSDD